MVRTLTLVLTGALFWALTPPAQAASVSGLVTSAADGEPLIYANVFLEGTAYGSMTNAQGYYVIPQIPAGTYRISFTYMGYSPEVRAITLAEREELGLSVELEATTIEVGVVDVAAGETAPRPEPSSLSLSTSELTRVPFPIEADLFRAVQALPGVSTLSDFSSGLYVRGGSADQNLILLDDVDVYNPSHLFGFFSTFNVDAVKRVDLQKSAYPARYGGRLSALLDVHNREGNRKRLAGVARVGMIGANVTLDGPWPRGSWMVAARRTYLDLIARMADLDLPYHFYDLHGRINFDVDRDDRVSLSLFRGRDRLDWDRDLFSILLDWGNDTWSTQWTHPLGSRIFSHFLVGGSRYLSEAEVAFRDFKFRMANEIDDISFKGNLSYTPSLDHLVDFGFEAKLLEFSWHQERGKDEELTFSYDGTYGALYGEYGWNPSARWGVKGGLRLNYYSGGDYFDLDPRFTVEREFSELVSAHLSYGRFHQYLNLVSEEHASFTDMWFPVDETLPPGNADHYVLGITLGAFRRFALSVEGYYKDYGNVVEFSEEFSQSLVEEDAELGEAFDSGEGEAYGADVYLRNNVAGLEGWLGYSWGHTRRRIAGYNYGLEYYPTYDRRHQFVAIEQYRLGGSWTLDLSFRYGTGQPTTLGAGRYTVRDATGREYDAILPGEFHAARLPAYHRLDIGVTWHTEVRGWDVEPTLQIINVYNRENVYFRFYDTSENPVVQEDVTMLPLIPTLGLKVAF